MTQEVSAKILWSDSGAVATAYILPLYSDSQVEDRLPGVGFKMTQVGGSGDREDKKTEYELVISQRPGS